MQIGKLGGNENFVFNRKFVRSSVERFENRRGLK